MSLAEVVFGRPLRDAFSFVNRLTIFSNRHIRRRPGVKLGEPKKMPSAFVSGATSQHYAETPGLYPPCLVVTESSFKTKLVTILVNGKKWDPSLKLFHSINMYRKLMDLGGLPKARDVFSAIFLPLMKLTPDLTILFKNRQCPFSRTSATIPLASTTPRQTTEIRSFKTGSNMWELGS